MMNRLSNKARILRHKTFSFNRVLPDFLIIGVPRAGTTSLYNYLTEHPSIYPALWKEINYYSELYDNGITWYKAHFASNQFKTYIEKIKKKKFLTGEATPNYFYHPLAPKRIHKIIPKVKLIVLLRNPVDRSHSHYWQSIRKHRESLSFKEAIHKQLELPQVYKESIDADTNMKTYFNPGNLYIAGGLYLDYIKNYLKIFPKKQFLILRSEDLYDNAQNVLNTVTDFLDVERSSLKKAIKYNFHADQAKMDETTRKKLLEFFKPHNEKLYKYMNVNFGWDT